MPASIRRHAVVLLLILGAGAASAGQLGQDRRDPALPAIAALTDRGSWQVETAYAPGNSGEPFRQWLLRDQAGTEALLYVGATSHVQVLVRWTGELGYQGEGYLVTNRGERPIRLVDGSTASVSRVLIERLADHRLLEYAVVRPDGVSPSGASSLLPTAWGVLTGRAGPYYLVRVSVPVGGEQAADRLLATLLAALSAEARAG